MSSAQIRVRLLEIAFKRFFNTLVRSPVRILHALRVVVQYENAFHRIVVWHSGDDAIDLGTSSVKTVVIIPPGEIWVPQVMQADLTTGETATMRGFLVGRKDFTGSIGWGTLKTGATALSWYRGGDYGVDQWLYPGDRLYLKCDVGNEGDKASVTIQLRKLRVGDDY